MGTIKKGILGGFSGKVGTVIGSSWKGIAYMRSIPQSVKNPRTQPQLMQRSKFSVTMSYLKPLNQILRTGWKLQANKQSPINAAMSYHIANAIMGDYPDYEIDVSKVLVSVGSLTPAVNAMAIVTGGTIEFSWSNNSGNGSAKLTDKVLIAVVNQARGEAVTSCAAAERKDSTFVVQLPANWSGDEVHIYLGFVSEDGREVSNSTYMGSVTIA